MLGLLCKVFNQVVETSLARKDSEIPSNMHMIEKSRSPTLADRPLNAAF